MVKTNDETTLNGAFLAYFLVIRNVMSLASESETGSLFKKTKIGTFLRPTLEEMGHPQPPTPLQTENSTANEIPNKRIQ